MKLVALWLATLAVAALAATSCSVNHRSGDFACQTSADCADGRICIDNLCVSTAPPDGGIANPNDGGAAGSCPDICTSCDVGSRTCKIDCSQSNGCKFPVTCPGGWNCDVECNTNGSCRSGITCADRQCKVECTGQNSCHNVACSSGACTVDCIGPSSCATVRGGSGPETVNCQGDGSCADVTCGTGRCNVDCAGDGSCAAASCGSACACDVECLGFDCDLTCGHNGKCQDAFGCTSNNPGCNSCPAGQ